MYSYVNHARVQLCSRLEYAPSTIEDRSSSSSHNLYLSWRFRAKRVYCQKVRWAKPKLDINSTLRPLPLHITLYLSVLAQ